MHATAIKDLARSGIDATHARACGIFSVADAQMLNPAFRRQAALVLPYFDPCGNIVQDNATPFFRVRYLGSAPTSFAKQPKYCQPPRSGVYAYYAPLLAWDSILSSDFPLLICEGEKKSIAGILAGFPTIGLGGVWNWGPREQRVFSTWHLKGREVGIAFDSDVATNAQVRRAQERLGDELTLLGARVRTLTLPSIPDGSKQGIDDLVVREGKEALASLWHAAVLEEPNELTREVLNLNRKVAWVGRDQCIYEPENHRFIRPASFMAGEKYSEKHILLPVTDGKLVVQQVSRLWLKHARARRYVDCLFRPGEPAEIVEESGISLNLWSPAQGTPGDISPWLELTEHLGQALKPEALELMVKFWAHKAQYPADKPAIAFFLVGPQGTGKSMWANAIHDAFQPYSTAQPSSALASDFGGWMERALVAVIHEVEKRHLDEHGQKLMGLISEKTHELNEKFRIKRQIQNYTSFILTTNPYEAASFQGEARRMFVIGCPANALPGLFYERFAAWRDNGGGKKLAHYFLNYNLQGWVPPQTAPDTAEKAVAAREGMTPIQALAQEMKDADSLVIQRWRASATVWAREAAGRPGAEGQAAARIDRELALLEVRPWYTAEELLLIFPALVYELQGSRWKPKTAGELSQELRNAGICFLRSADNERGFLWRGAVRNYLVVAETVKWSRPVTQVVFEDCMRRWTK